MPFDAGMQIFKHIGELIRDYGKVIAETGALPLHFTSDHVESLPLVQSGNPQHYRENDRA